MLQVIRFSTDPKGDKTRWWWPNRRCMSCCWSCCKTIQSSTVYSIWICMFALMSRSGLWCLDWSSGSRMAQQDIREIILIMSTWLTPLWSFCEGWIQERCRELQQTQQESPTFSGWTSQNLTGSKTNDKWQLGSLKDLPKHFLSMCSFCEGQMGEKALAGSTKSTKVLRASEVYVDCHLNTCFFSMLFEPVQLLWQSDASGARNLDRLNDWTKNTGPDKYIPKVKERHT